jgi:hypothetical protein
MNAVRVSEKIFNNNIHVNVFEVKTWFFYLINNAILLITVDAP